MTIVSFHELEKRIAESELGQECIDHPLINRDVWPLRELNYSKEECRIKGRKNFYFNNFSCPWLNLLTKLTVLARIRQRHSIEVTAQQIQTLKHLDKFLDSFGYTKPQSLSDFILQKFVSQKTKNKKGHQRAISYAVQLWTEEGWLSVSFTYRRYKESVPKIEIIPEFVLFQVYEKLDLFPPPLERLFRLQLVLGARIGELLRIPRQCLKREQDRFFLLRWIEKRKNWKFWQIHPLVAELVREQQQFLDEEFGKESLFENLFCQVSAATMDGASPGKRFEKQAIYLPKLLPISNIGSWLRDFSKTASLQDKYGNRFYLKSHMFRRTKASIMAHCEAEDEYIAAVLGHGSLDMLSHYRQRSLERLEKESKTKGYVDMYGRVTSFKPKNRRYEKLANLLFVNTQLGECHRPSMLGDCQYRYACLSCGHHRVTLEDLSNLEVDRRHLQEDLEKARSLQQQRLITEIERLLELLENRLQGLKKLQNIKEKKVNG